MNPQQSWTSHLGAALIVTTALVVFGAYAWVATGSVTHPYGLEWMEGGSVDVVARVADGAPIYTGASLEYVPYIYAPFYYVVTGIVSKPFGPGFVLPRLVSLLSVVGTGWLLFSMVREQTGQRLSGLAAAGLYIGCYELCGRWYHLARVDSLFVLGLAATLWLLLRPHSRKVDLVCGLVMAATVLTKQTGLVAFAPLGLWLMVTDWRRGVWVGSVSLGVLGLTLVVAQASTDGHFVRYLWTIPSSHPMVPELVARFWFDDVRRGWPMLLGAAVMIGLPGPSGKRAWWAAVLLGFVGGAWLSRVHSGGALNALMPGMLAASLGSGCAIGRALQAGARRGDRRIPLAIGVAFAAQVGWLGLPSAAGRPSPDDEELGDRFVAHLESLPGDVLLPDHRFVQTRAGKRSHGLGMAAADVLRSDAAPHERARLQREIVAALSEHRFSHVILSVKGGWISSQVQRHYCPAGSLDLAPVPVAGAPHRPRWVYVSRGDPACKKRRRKRGKKKRR